MSVYDYVTQTEFTDGAFVSIGTVLAAHQYQHPQGTILRSNIEYSVCIPFIDFSVQEDSRSVKRISVNGRLINWREYFCYFYLYV